MRIPFLTALLVSAVAFLPQEEQAPRPVPKVGEAAPTIRLNDHEGRAVSVGGEAEHWTVLAFYPRAMTPG